MEKAVFTVPEIRAIFRDFVVVTLWVDDPDREVAGFVVDLEDRLISSSKQPAYVVIDPETEQVLGNWGYERAFISEPDLFGKRLERALTAFRASRGPGSK